MRRFWTYGAHTFGSGSTITSAGDLNSDELERLVTIIQNPTQFKIPTWFLNRQKDIVDGKNSQILSNGVDSKLRDDLERLKKIRAHRGLRHFWGLRVRGQHTKTTGSSMFHLVLLVKFLIPCPLTLQAAAERPSVCRRSVVKPSSPILPLVCIACCTIYPCARLECNRLCHWYRIILQPPRDHTNSGVYSSDEITGGLLYMGRSI